MADDASYLVPIAESSERRMKLRYAGACRICGTELPGRTDAIYERGTKTVRCVECPAAAPTDAIESESGAAASMPKPTLHEPGVAGSSARREYERRKGKDVERLRERWKLWWHCCCTVGREAEHEGVGRRAPWARKG